MIQTDLIVLRALAEEGRTLLSRWRGHLYLRRALDPLYPEGRSNRLFVRMDRDGLLEPLAGTNKQLYRVTSPYAPDRINAHELVQEAYYSSAFCYATALELHRLSEQRERQLHLFVPRSSSGATTRRRVGRRGPAFEVQRIPGTDYHWTLVDARGAQIAVAATSHARREEDLDNIEQVREGARGEAPLQSEIVAASEDEYRWHWKNEGEGVLAVSADSYPSKAQAVAAAREAANTAAEADIRDQSSSPTRDLLPPGTSPEDWRLCPLPSFIRVSEAGPYEVATHATKPVWLFGFTEVEADGVGVRVTDVERTLIDGLRHPKLCGGLSEVFRAWVRALERGVSRKQLVAYAERFDQAILYQRLGFVMEALGLDHPAHERWKQQKVIRGGSRLLDADRPYVPAYSEAWALSINHPTAILKNRDTTYS